jgi:hypothetical protein
VRKKMLTKVRKFQNPEQRRMLAGLLRSLAEIIESEAEGSEVAEKSEQTQGSSAETESD